MALCTAARADEAQNLLQEARGLSKEFAQFDKEFAGKDFEVGSDDWRRMRDEQTRVEKLDRDYKLKLDTYFTARIEALGVEVNKDREAINRLGLKSRAEDFEEWAKLSEETRADLQKQALEALISTGLSAAQSANKIAASTNPWNANKMVTRLKSAGVKSETLFAAIRRVGATRGKPEAAEAVNEWIDAFSKARDLDNIERSIKDAKDASAKRTAWLEGLATVLGWGLDDQRFSLLVTEIQLTTAAIYNNATQRVVAARIDQLTSMTEQQLLGLKGINVLLKRHVTARERAKKALAATKLADKLPALLPEPALGAANNAGSTKVTP
jgi:hypothetical protein